jgi:hypothetical protein
MAYNLNPVFHLPIKPGALKPNVMYIIILKAICEYADRNGLVESIAIILE